MESIEKKKACQIDTDESSSENVTEPPEKRSAFMHLRSNTPTHPRSRPKELSLDGSQTREIHLLSVIAMSFLPQLVWANETCPLGTVGKTE
ncbi:hypothetical protein DPX16_10900 [Anabarilius grahami]|uniref:Uncharacterized protein n=1 Tax=Anabarilius grahami TaxID=495550 RepID=A0A3N0Z7N0_ANAGA|nr:hypothetical protein DPX16_10900 [Anabarilius grahami]